MTKPEVREAMLKVANRVALVRKELDLIEAEIRALKQELHSRSPIARAPRTSSPITPAIRAGVRTTHRTHPKMSFTAIGRLYNIDKGRVSEILHGKRT